MSGDMCTSLGNGFTNLMLALFIAEEKQGLLRGLVEGDDGIFATNFTLAASDYARLGFTIKIIEVADPCHASFCGIICTDDGDIIRDPRRFFSSFGWSASFLGCRASLTRELLHAKALSAMFETPNCPLVSELAWLALQATINTRPRFVEDGYHRPAVPKKLSPPAVKFSTRVLFAEVYQVPVPVQFEIERQIRTGNLSGIQDLIVPHDHVSHYALRYVEQHLLPRASRMLAAPVRLASSWPR